MKVLVVALLLASCSSPNAPGSSEPLVLTRLRPDLFSYSYYSGIRDSQRLVIRDQAAWQQTWNTISIGMSPVSAPPAIDFSREMVIVAALGERPTGGFSIFVDAATETTNGVTITVRSVSPGSGCAVTLAITRPVDIARVTRRDGTVNFAETVAIQACAG